MKKIKTINKLLSSLALLSSLSGIGFNNQYQNTQKVITENNNNLLNNNYVTNLTNDQRTMGDITVTVDGTKITGFVSSIGEKKLIVDSDITEIGNNAFENQSTNIDYLDLSKATNLTIIGDNAFSRCTNLTGDLVIPSSVTSIGAWAFQLTQISSLNLSQATSLTTIGNGAFSWCSNLTGDLFIPSSVTSIGESICSRTNITSITIDPSNTTYSLAKNLGSSACVVLSGTDGIWKDDSKSVGELALGDIVIPSNVTSIRDDAFYNTKITSLDLSQATSLTTIEGDGTHGDQGAFSYCQNLTGDLVIPSNVTSIGGYAFYNTKITSLDLSQTTSLTTIGRSAFQSCSNLTGDLVIPSSVTSIESRAFAYCSNLTGDLVIPSSVEKIGDMAFSYINLDNLYFLSETPPTSFESYWKPTITGKVYVPSEEAKQAYLKAENFGFSADQVEVDLPNNKSNTGLILGLIFGLGIPVILAIAFIIWYAIKKKETTVKIKKKK